MLLVLSHQAAIAGHLQEAIPQGIVRAVCLDEGTALELSPLSDNEFKLAIEYTEDCFRLVYPDGADEFGQPIFRPIEVSAWMTRVVGCVVNADEIPICVVEIHNAGGHVAYTWIVGTQEEIEPIMDNGGRSNKETRA